MILLDFSAIAIGSEYVKSGDLEQARVVLLNKIRAYNKKYGSKYGQMVICCDSGSWRKRVFPLYKAKRKAHREDSDLDWELIFKNINTILDEIRENVPWIVIQHHEAEGDDVIATLAKSTQEFGKSEPTIIIAADHDYKQLQRYPNISQYSPRTKKMVVLDEHPVEYLRTHIIKGDGGDGIPNILSDEDTFIHEDKKQTTMTQQRLDKLLSNFGDEKAYGEEVYKRFLINQQCVDFDYIPDDITEGIINKFENYKLPHKTKVLNYLVKNRCKQLITQIGDFY